MNKVLHSLLQRKLDFLDESIDTLAREKTASGDDDFIGDIDEAQQLQQMARQSYSQGEMDKAFAEAARAERAVFVGREALDRWNKLTIELDEILNPKKP